MPLSPNHPQPPDRHKFQQTGWRQLLSSSWKSEPYFCHSSGIRNLFSRDNKMETFGGQAIPNSWSCLRNGEVMRGQEHTEPDGHSLRVCSPKPCLFVSQGDILGRQNIYYWNIWVPVRRVSKESQIAWRIRVTMVWLLPSHWKCRCHTVFGWR